MLVPGRRPWHLSRVTAPSQGLSAACDHDVVLRAAVQIPIAPDVYGVAKEKAVYNAGVSFLLGSLRRAHLPPRARRSGRCHTRACGSRKRP